MPGSKRDWLDKTYGPAVRRNPERDTPFETSSGQPVEPLYTADDLSPATDPGLPGEYPYTRGVQPTMYRGRLWTMRQYAGFGDAEGSNARYRYLISQGQTGLSVAFDLPTQIGYDPGHPLAAGEVGKVGVSISSIDDMETLFRDIRLDTVTTSMTINATASILLALYVAVARRQGSDLRRLSGTLQNDILKEYIARGTHIFPPRPSLRLITDVFAWCKTALPEWNTISISGYHMREAGSTAAQEVAFTLSNAVAYVEAARSAGLAVDEFAPRLSFFFACHSLFFEEAAKFRAARRLWARIMKDRFGARDPRSLMLRFHTQTGGATLTAQQPENNIVRTAYQALAAVLGGTQSLHTNAMDEALALPSEDAARLALRTQQVLAYETGVADTIDPLGGSYYVETLTGQVEDEARAYIEHIDSLGGALAAIEQGYQRGQIEENAYRLQKSLEDGRRVVVGVNAFGEELQPGVLLLRVDEAIEKRQVERVHALRQTRDPAPAATALDRIEAAARGTDNLMPLFIDAVEARATLGEICDRLRLVWGEQANFNMT
ncbi:MAG: methylmalonyl-CoA mutase [Dehalococcoidia bacterium]|nr:methylmalonyl-CoA mutase [Dehalococcoidia bacterium]